MTPPAPRLLTPTFALLGFALAPAGAAERVVFADDFGPSSRGARERNLVVEPAPVGMGYTTDTPFGFRLRHWIVADEEPDRPRRAFWCIPERADGTVEAYAQQSARSHNSICFAATPLPAGAAHYAVEFRQWCNDNDTIAYILGASRPVLVHDGAEFGYQRQLPGTDTTVEDIHYKGALGEGKIAGRAMMRRWAAHRIEVRGTHVAWRQDGVLLLQGEVPALRPGGYFGIRQRYERGTRYDDVRIVLLAQAAP
jgi:hypothetical protein